MVIAHSNCGACHMNGQQMKELMIKRGIHQDVIDTIGLCGIDLDHWLEGFHDTEDSVRNTVNTIRNHPLVPKDVNLHGYIIDSQTGKLTEVKYFFKKKVINMLHTKQEWHYNDRKRKYLKTIIIK